MADGLNFTVGAFPPSAIEYSSTEAEPSHSSDVRIPSVLMSGIMIFGQMMWCRLSSNWGTVKGSLSEAEIAEHSEEENFSR